MITHALTAGAVAAVLSLASVAAAASSEPPTRITLVLADHRFTPSAFTVPAGQAVHVTLINRDPATEEFDSDDLGLEETVTPMGKTEFDLGPLKAGQYHFMGEFHPETAQGLVTAVGPGQ